MSWKNKFTAIDFIQIFSDTNANKLCNNTPLKKMSLNQHLKQFEQLTENPWVCIFAEWDGLNAWNLH